MSAVHHPHPHDSAAKHVTGEARYVDDLPEPRDLLHVYARPAEHARARITRLEVTAVREAPAVAAVLTAAELPVTNDIGPVIAGDQILADGEVLFHGQPLFAVAAETIPAARWAAGLAEVDYEPLPAVLTVDEALDADADLLPPRSWQRGEPESAIAAAPRRLAGTTYVGGQEHFYLEGQVSMAIPQEDGDMLVYSSTQHPSEVQHLVAKVLGVPDHAVTVETRRMGGAFGGKETQAAQFAVIAALLAARTGRPVKYRLDRDDDITMTGKRHDLRIDYEVGFDDDGRIRGITFLQAVRCGYAPDLSHSVADRAMYHADNAYFLENVAITSRRLRTNTVSNTAFRGFGGPQGMIGIEHVMDAIAREIGADPLAVRRRNLYGVGERDITPYGMRVEDNILPELLPEMEAQADYARRRQAVAAFNSGNRWLKKGIAITPVKFGISFTAKFLNQAGALVLVYQDGSVQLNHGGTEMGQGLHMKVAQVVAEAFGIDLERVRITATSTGKVPNTSPTAASSGSDLNGAAAHNAAMKIVDRLLPVIRDRYEVATDTPIRFRDNAVYAGDRWLAGFAEVVQEAYYRRVPLSATGFYATPKLEVHADGTGRPFYYFAYGAACSEVLMDTLTGEYRVTRVDILHDVGRSLNPAIDMGQIEGGFIQGMGWLTTEELHWDQEGRLTTHAPSTYKIPACSDLPRAFHARIYERGENTEAAIHRSKAVGEPPLMLAISVLHALRDAVAAAAPAGGAVALDAPATPEAVLRAIHAGRRVEAPEATVEPAE
ncbi:xanthine dehydrogenase molybdopterin binding subunit [Arhodomonas sp. SL1]|uniref:xanthine dehydrogenase molybdopterin binding subunit n=1 Tax=Arhodomonas sp. SL1 TaxID=3425691 RepID=UPI003F88527F